jgi:hypothetical protein
VRLYDADGNHRSRSWTVRAAFVGVAVALMLTSTVSAPARASANRPKSDLLTEGQALALVAKMGIVAHGEHLLRSTRKSATPAEPARYDFSYAARAASREARTYVSVAADGGLLLNFSRPADALAFRYPLPVSRSAVQKRAVADARRLYPSLLADVRLQGVAVRAGSLRHALTWQFVFTRVVDGIPAPFDGIRLALNEYGQLLGVSCRWTRQSFPTPAIRITRAQAEAIYRNNLHFVLSYQPQWGDAGNQVGTVLAYTDEIGLYPLDWDVSYSVGAPIQGPVIAASTGDVIDSSGAVRPLPAAPAVTPLQRHGPAINLTAGKPANLDSSQAIALARRDVGLGAAFHLQASAPYMATPSGDRAWYFLFDGPDRRSVDVSIDATRGLLIGYTVSYGTPAPRIRQMPAQAQIDRTVVAFIKRLFPLDVHGIGLVPADHQPTRDRVTAFTVQFLVDGVPVQAEQGELDYSLRRAAIADFFWSPVAHVPSMPPARDRVSVRTVVANWMAADPLRLTWLQTGTRSADPSLPQTLSQQPHVVLAWAATGDYGLGTGVPASTGALPTAVAIYTGPLHVQGNPAAAPYIRLLVRRGLWPGSARGVVDAGQVIDRGEFVELLEDALGTGEQPAPNLSAPGPRLQRLLTGMVPGGLMFNAVLSAYDAGWLAGSAPFAPTEPLTRAAAAQILARALGFGPLLAHPTVLALLPTTVTGAGTSLQRSAESVAVRLHLFALVHGRFAPGAAVTLGQAATAVVVAADESGS